MKKSKADKQLLSIFFPGGQNKWVEVEPGVWVLKEDYARIQLIKNGGKYEHSTYNKKSVTK